MQTGERSIFERGCLRAGEEWLELNLVPVAGTVVSTMVLQVDRLKRIAEKKEGFKLSPYTIYIRLFVTVHGAALASIDISPFPV